MSTMLIQFLFILIPFILSFFYPIQNFFYAIIDTVWNSTRLELFLGKLVSNELLLSIITGLLLSVFIYLGVIRMNNDKLFNKGNKYSNYPYWIFWTASKIFNYEKVTLVGIPIPMQFRLVINDTFPEIEVDKAFINEEHLIEDKEVEIRELEQNDINNEINLVLVDTYDIKKDELPKDKIDLPTIIIKSGNQIKGNRSINPSFVKEIRTQTNNLSRKYDKVNIFATTNTNHTKLIIEKCFKNAGRTGFTNIFVYQASRDNYKFEKSYLII